MADSRIELVLWDWKMWLSSKVCIGLLISLTVICGFEAGTQKNVIAVRAVLFQHEFW